MYPMSSYFIVSGEIGEGSFERGNDDCQPNCNGGNSSWKGEKAYWHEGCLLGLAIYVST